MTGHDPAQRKQGSLPLLAVVCAATLPFLAGCSDFRQIVGLDQAGPDEFAVETRAPLTIPPDFDLRPPKPGAPRPQEVNSAERARQAMDTAGPGKPGDQASFALQAPPGAMIGGAERPDPNREVSPNSLAGKLLGAGNTASAGEKRETSTLKGVY